ncbi:MAG: phosphoenolpyruvate synthase [Kofleriaceae bacterium]|nr:phosphoenolpyruvate synthase [Kofleriaceae bacterium]
MNQFTLGFADLDGPKLGLAGGKGATLSALSRISGIRVPAGVCVSTDAFARVVGDVGAQLAGLRAEQRDEIRARSAEVRQAIQGLVMPSDLRDEIARAVAALGERAAFAVRSSATAEDLPTASFAGQHDTYLDVTGTDEIIRHVVKCWASLFTERAVAYRAQHGLDQRSVRMAVVVQKMVVPAVSGVLFTADPLSGNRKVTSIDASFGLGEALVSGRVQPDVYRVRDGTIVEKKIVTPRQALTDAQLVELERIGRTIEAHVGRPQDIEWCLADDGFYVVQSRPITTLFPIPERDDAEPHVYISVGHGQMMTDAMRPLGQSVFQLTAMAPMFAAGGRLFVDVTRGLMSPARANLLNVMGNDPLIKDALVTLLERCDFLPPATMDAPPPRMVRSHHGMSAAEIAAPVARGAQLVGELIEDYERALAALNARLRRARGAELFDVILEDLGQLKQQLADPRNMAAVMAGIHASAWLNENVEAWLGDKHVADTIARSLPTNITSEMGVALLDVADALRPFPAVIEQLQRTASLEGLAKEHEARAAIDAFLEKYGMRCAGEIDITRDRWAEAPSTLIRLLLGHVKHAAPGAGRRLFALRRAAALATQRGILERLRQLPDGDEKAAEAARMIGLLRDFMGYREYPKYHIVSRYLVYKQALLREADALVHAQVIEQRDDIYYLTFHELYDGVRTQRIDRALIEQRREEHRAFEKLTPPRVLTSDGEVIVGRYKRGDVPADALVGLAVSTGVIEGRARVVRSMEEAELEEGDILVTLFTDPSWTPLFVSAKGLVTEVGGLMTHGAVIAREYGLPAVVGVEQATQRIRDGQRIRVNGTDGFVELLG